MRLLAAWWAAGFASAGLVAAGVVEFEVAHEVAVDEHVGVGAVEIDVAGLAGELGAEPDGP